MRAEDSIAQHPSDSSTCARSAFRVLIDVGHTATSPGADSARGVPEYEFNLQPRQGIAQARDEGGFDRTDWPRAGPSVQRSTSANNLQADLFISILHDSVPDNLNEPGNTRGRNTPTATGLAATSSSFLMWKKSACGRGRSLRANKVRCWRVERRCAFRLAAPDIGSDRPARERIGRSSAAVNLANHSAPRISTQECQNWVGLSKQLNR